MSLPANRHYQRQVLPNTPDGHKERLAIFKDIQKEILVTIFIANTDMGIWQRLRIKLELFVVQTTLSKEV
jgi:hypothetical protein